MTYEITRLSLFSGRLTDDLVVCLSRHAGTSLLQIPAGRERTRRTVSVEVEAELQESSAVHHLLRLDRGRAEGAGCPHAEGAAHLTGVLQAVVLHQGLTPTVVLIIAMTDTSSAYSVQHKAPLELEKRYYYKEGLEASSSCWPLLSTRGNCSRIERTGSVCSEEEVEHKCLMKT